MKKSVVLDVKKGFRDGWEDVKDDLGVPKLIQRDQRWKRYDIYGYKLNE